MTTNIITLVPFRWTENKKFPQPQEAVVIIAVEGDSNSEDARISATDKLIQKFDGVISFENKSDQF